MTERVDGALGGSCDQAPQHVGWLRSGDAVSKLREDKAGHAVDAHLASEELVATYFIGEIAAIQQRLDLLLIKA